MLWVYLLLVATGIALTVRLAARRSRQLYTSAAGTVVAVLAVLGGFSIGIYLATASAVVLILAGSRDRRGAT